MNNIQKQIEALEEQISAVTAIRDALQPEYHRIGAELNKHHNTLTDLGEKIQELKLSTISANDIGWLLSENWSTAVRDAFAKLVGFGEYELGLEGSWVETNQSAIRITLTRNDPVKSRQIWDKMIELLPHVIPQSDGYRRIDILDHDLSESGVVYILVDSKNLFYKSVTCYGRTSITKIGGSQEAFAYFFANHYYE